METEGKIFYHAIGIPTNHFASFHRPEISYGRECRSPKGKPHSDAEFYSTSPTHSEINKFTIKKEPKDGGKTKSNKGN